MKDKILFVDDEENILFSMRRNLRMFYDVHTALDAEEGLQILEAEGPFKVVVSDYRMPGTDGMQFLIKVRDRYPKIMRIMLTGQAEFQTAIDAVNHGDLFRFITKPFPPSEMKLILQDAIKQYKLVESEKDLLQKTLNGAIKLMVDILSITYPTAFSFTGRLRELAKKVGHRLEVKQKWQLELAASLSQIGVIGLPAELIEKAYMGTELNEEELTAFQSHYEAGSNFVGRIPRLESIAEGIYSQGKHFDGGGVPADEVAGKEIPFLSRLLKVLFDFQVLANAGLDSEEAIDVMQAKKGIYDPSILIALSQELNEMEEGLALKQLKIIELRSGMVIAEDLYTTSEVLLMKRYSELNDVNILRLSGLVREQKIPQFISVFVEKSE